MQYKFVKEGSPIEGPLNDLFYVDSFTPGQPVTRNQIIETLDAYQYKSRTKSTLIHERVANYILTNMSTEKAIPLNEMATFCYLMFYTEQFQYKSWCTTIINAINVDNTFLYFSDNNIVVPGGFVKVAASIVNDPTIMDIIIQRHNFVIDADITDIEEVKKFEADLATNVHEYLTHMESIKSAFE